MQIALYQKSKTVENGFSAGSVILITWLKPGANEKPTRYCPDISGVLTSLGR
jgi:hypothetical protein